MSSSPRRKIGRLAAGCLILGVDTLPNRGSFGALAGKTIGNNAKMKIVRRKPIVHRRSIMAQSKSWAEICQQRLMLLKPKLAYLHVLPATIMPVRKATLPIWIGRVSLGRCHR
jgi:hypothetical protein